MPFDFVHMLPSQGRITHNKRILEWLLLTPYSRFHETTSPPWSYCHSVRILLGNFCHTWKSTFSLAKYTVVSVLPLQVIYGRIFKTEMRNLGALLTHLLRAWLSRISRLMEEPIALIISLRALFQNTYQPRPWTQSAQITKYIKSAPIPYIYIKLYHLHSWTLTHSTGRNFTLF